MENKQGIRIVGLLLVLLLTVFFLTVIFYNANNRVKDNTSSAANTNTVLYQSEKLLSLLGDIKRATLGYVITSDSTFSQSISVAKDSSYTTITTLKKLTADNPAQYVIIDTLQKLADEKIKLCYELQQLQIGNIYTSGTAKKLLTEDKKLSVDIKKYTISLQQEEEKKLWDLRKKTESRRSKNTWILILSSMLAAAIIIFTIIKYYKKIKAKQDDPTKASDPKLIFFSKRIDEIVKGISDPIFALDKDLNFIFYNDAVLQGIGTGKGKLMDKNIFEIFPQYKNNIIGEKINEVIKTNNSSTFEAFEDFLEKWLDITVYPTVEGVSVYFKDVSERKAYEKKLDTMKQLLEETNKVALIGGWEIDVKTGKITWTSVTHFIHETEPDFQPTLKMAINFYKEGKDREMITQAVNDAIKYKKHWEAELKIITAKGNERWVYVNGTPEFEGDECVRVLGIFQDIDAQKKANNLLSQNEQQFRSAFYNSFDGMALVNLDLSIIKVNHATCNMLGYTPEELLLLNLNALTHIEDKATDAEIYNKLINGTLKKWQYQKRFIHKQGHFINTLVSISSTKATDDSIINFVIQLQNIREIIPAT